MGDFQTIKRIYIEIFDTNPTEDLSTLLFATQQHFDPRNVQRCVFKVKTAETRKALNDALQDLKDSGSYPL